jgi:antirestriction protein ArdC
VSHTEVVLTSVVPGKGEQGSLVVYANKIIRTETDQATGEESEHAIPFMKG